MVNIKDTKFLYELNKIKLTYTTEAWISSWNSFSIDIFAQSLYPDS